MAAAEVATAVDTAVAAATGIHLVVGDIPPGGNLLHLNTYHGGGTDLDSGSPSPFARHRSPPLPFQRHGIFSLATQLLRLSIQFLTRMALNSPVIQ